VRLTKINLTALVAIGHSGGHLELLLDRGDTLEQISVPAPLEAYEGLLELEEMMTDLPLLIAIPEQPKLPSTGEIHGR